MASLKIEHIGSGAVNGHIELTGPPENDDNTLAGEEMIADVYNRAETFGPLITRRDSSLRNRMVIIPYRGNWAPAALDNTG